MSLAASYHDSSSDEEDGFPPTRRRNAHAARQTLRNFVVMAILFSANHGCTVSCLALATARLGSVGAWQSGTLYLTYTSSALLGATYFTKRLGSRNAIIMGMALYCAYVACFLVATQYPEISRASALLGAAIGGVGGGFLWTAQGAYFGQASEEHAKWLQQDVTLSTAHLAGLFAFIYLAEEVLLRVLSSALLETFSVSWSIIFGIYTVVAIVSTMGMVLVYNYPASQEDTPVFYKVTAALQLLRNDAKMKYMIGLNAVFGFAGAFVNSYVNGQVVRVALDDSESKFVGILSALVAAVAAISSLILSRVSQHYGKGPILIGGALCFMCVAMSFIVQPNAEQWNWFGLILVYTLQGMGRATFESTLKATFADYFPQEKEGAFANIILQNGLSSAVGYVLSFRLENAFIFELTVVVTALLAIGGYWRASVLYKREQERIVEDDQSAEAELMANEVGVST